MVTTASPRMTLPFLLLAALTAGSAIAAMSLRNLVHCALCLVATFAGLAALYLQLNAEFVGFVQVLVYIGAVAILIVFAILLTRGTDPAPPVPIATAGAWPLAIALAAFVVMVGAINQSAIHIPAALRPPAVDAEGTTNAPPALAATPAGPVPEAMALTNAPGAAVATVPVKALGMRLMEEYVVPLEVMGLLLTAALLGAVLIALPERRAKSEGRS
jgi:NADH-quinone oxidoreductase subunit J